MTQNPTCSQSVAELNQTFICSKEIKVTTRPPAWELEGWNWSGRVAQTLKTPGLCQKSQVGHRPPTASAWHAVATKERGITNGNAPATRKHLSHISGENRSQRGVCKQGRGRGRAVHRRRVSKFVFFKIKARTGDAPQRTFRSKLNPGHGGTGLEA